MNVLVTGSLGFVASALLEKLHTNFSINNLIGCNRKSSTLPKTINSDFDIFEIGQLSIYRKEINHYDFYCDISCENQVRTLLEKTQPDIIFHLAAKSSVAEDKVNPFEIYDQNLLATHYLLKYCKPGCKFVFASSILVYGESVNQNKFDDNSIFDLNPNSVYGITKLAAEKLVRNYHKEKKIDGIILRLGAVTGKGNTHGVIAALLNKLLAKPEPKILEVLGDYPGSTKPFSHVDDVVDALILSVNNPWIRNNDRPHIVNVCADDEINIEGVANAVMEGLGVKKEIKWLGENANFGGDTKFVGCHNDKAKYMGWRPKYPLSRDAIIQSVRDSIS